MPLNRKRPEPLAVPLEKKPAYILTNSGRFTEGDLTISRDGMMIAGMDSPSVTRPGSAGITSVAEEDSSCPMEVVDAAAPRELQLEDLQEIRVLGSGSSGVAKQVLNRHTGEALVLKVIAFDVNSDVIRRQVTMELRTLYGASHPHVVKYHQAFFDNGAVTIVMEHMDAGSLADLLKQMKRLPEPYLAAVARALVSGLTYLHKELHIVHRDIKPSNLLINRSGELKISDFGVSGQLANSISNCVSWVGTITYMSPERIKGEEYSYTSDIWSLGLTIMEAATGRYPYPPAGEGAPRPLGFWELLDYIVEQPAVTLPKEVFSPELCDFVRMCLQKDERCRPAISDLAKHPFLGLHMEASLADLLATPQ